MIVQGDILITKVKTLIVEDLNLLNKIYNFSSNIPMSAIEFYVEKGNLSESENSNILLNEYVYNIIEKQLPSSKIWLFPMSYVVDNKLSRYRVEQQKKNWKASIISKLESERFSSISDDLIVDIKDNYLILGTMYQVNKNSFDYSIKMLKEHSSVMMFISPNNSFDSKENIKNIYKHYRKQFYTSYHPSKGLEYLNRDDILVRTGVIEEHCVPFIDFFLSPSKLLEMKLDS